MGGALMCALLAHFARRPHARDPGGRDRKGRAASFARRPGAASARRLRCGRCAVHARTARCCYATPAGAKPDLAAPQASPLWRCGARRHRARRRPRRGRPGRPAGFRSNASAPRIDRSAGDILCRRLQPLPPPNRRPSKPLPPSPERQSQRPCPPPPPTEPKPAATGTRIAPSAASRFASSGRWTTTAASRSTPTNSRR